MALAGEMGQDQVAARRHPPREFGDDPGRVVGVRDPVQDGHEQDRDRPGEIDQLARAGVVEDPRGAADVLGDDREVGVMPGQQRPGVGEYHRVGVDVSTRASGWTCLATSWVLPWLGRPAPRSMNWVMPATFGGA
jgi:hypothetical protein